MDAKEFRQVLMNVVRERNKKLLGILADAKIGNYEPGSVSFVLPPGYKFHYDEILKNKAFLEEVSQELLGTKIKIECRVDEAHQGPSGEQEHDAMIRKAHGLFAGEIINS